jgi:hypothetical protein
MSTPPVPTTTPDRPGSQPRAERRPSDHTPQAQVLPPSGTDRAADADLLVDIPQLSVDELALEVESSLVLNRVKLDAKGLQVGLFLKADLEHVVQLAQERSERHEGGRLRRQRGAEVDRVRSGLRELLGAAREQEPALAAADEGRREPPRARDDDAMEDEERHHQDGNGTRPHAGRHSAAQGAVAAGLTAAGLAGGALLEARVKPSRKLHIPRRRTRAQVIRDEIAKRLP